MNELSTKLYKINFQYIIDNCLDRKLWGKSWLVYDYDNCKINVRLNTIEVERNEIMLRISGQSLWDYTYITLPLSKDHFNEKVFYQKVFSAIEYVLQEEERNAIRKMDIYKQAKDLDNDTNIQNEEYAHRYLDTLGVEDNDVRNAFVDAYVRDHESTYGNDVLYRLRYKIQPQRYLMLAHQFEQYAPEKSNGLLDIVMKIVSDKDYKDLQTALGDIYEKIMYAEMGEDE